MSGFVRLRDFATLEAARGLPEGAIVCASFWVILARAKHGRIDIYH